MRRISKLIGTLLGGITGTAVVAVGQAAGVELDPEVAAAAAVLLAALGAYLAPRNADPVV